MAMMQSGERRRREDDVHEGNIAGEMDEEVEVVRKDHFGFEIKDEREEFH